MTEQQENTTQEQVNSYHEPQGDVVTVVLTADNHLGFDAFGQQKREERQQHLRDAFQQAVIFAIGQKADFFIQAGDLFDTATPTERDRSFVAARLTQLKQAGVRVIALGGLHDTPTKMQGEHTTSAPQMSYAQLDALQYLPPLHKDEEVEPLLIETHGIMVGVCGLSSVGEQEGDLLAQLQIQNSIERATLPILVLHAPIEGLTENTGAETTRAYVTRTSIEQQHIFRYMLAGYYHTYSHQRIGQTEVIVAGATDSINSIQQTQEQQPGFVFMGLAADGLRWCNHIIVNALQAKRLDIATRELWSGPAGTTPTERILERLEPLCDAESIIQLRLKGKLTRRQYHQLDLNTIRRYGEEHCFSLAIDDSNVSLVSDADVLAVGIGKRFSPREELIAVAEERIADTHDEQEQKALRNTKEALLLALDDSRGTR